MTEVDKDGKTSIMRRYENRRHCNCCGSTDIRGSEVSNQFFCCTCKNLGSSEEFGIKSDEVEDPNIIFLFKVKDFLDKHNLVIDEVTLGIEHDYEYVRHLKSDVLSDTKANIQLRVKVK